jgi:hypothetical protein
MNKTTTGIFIGILSVGFILFAVLFFVNSSNLSKSRQDLDTTNAQLTQLQQKYNALQSNANNYQNQLTQAQNTISTLQNKINILTQPPLVAGQPIENDGQLSRTAIATIPITLKAFEQVQGQIIVSSTQFPLRVYIQDPSGKTVQDFGLVYQSNFQFTAQTSQQDPLAGTYSIVIANTAGVDFMDIGYKLTYTVYHLQ